MTFPTRGQLAYWRLTITEALLLHLMMPSCGLCHEASYWLATSPQHAPLYHLLGLRNLQISYDMSERAIEDTTIPPALFPGDRHHTSRNPGGMFATEGCGCQYLIQRINVHVILFRVHAKVAQASCDGVIMVDNMDVVIDASAGMGNPLPTYHELILGIVAKRVSHTPMPTSNSNTTLDSFEQSFFLLFRNCSHCPDGHNQVKRVHLGIISV